MTLALLSGIRVLDLSQWIPGPCTAQTLADLGAQVLKIEPPGGDPMRKFDPPDEDGLCAAYKLVNAGKRIVTLDLKADAGREQARTLLAAADVLVESFRPGTLDRLGLSADVRAQVNPRLIHVGLSGWGQTGPYRLRAGHDLTYMAVAGAIGLTGTTDEPAMPCPPMSDHASALLATMAVTAALFSRERTGRGASLDVSMMETMLGWQSLGLTHTARGQPTARGMTMLTGGAAWYRSYATADGRFVALAAIEPKFWQQFCTAVDRPDWLDRQNDPLPQTALIHEIATLFADHTLSHWLELLGPVDCCVEAVLDLAELSDHPQIAARGQVVRLEAENPRTPPLVQTLLGLRLDGGNPPSRTPLRFISIEQALTDWSA